MTPHKPFLCAVLVMTGFVLTGCQGTSTPEGVDRSGVGASQPTSGDGSPRPSPTVTHGRSPSLPPTSGPPSRTPVGQATSAQPGASASAPSGPTAPSRARATPPNGDYTFAQQGSQSYTLGGVPDSSTLPPQARVEVTGSDASPSIRTEYAPGRADDDQLIVRDAGVSLQRAQIQTTYHGSTQTTVFAPDRPLLIRPVGSKTAQSWKGTFSGSVTGSYAGRVEGCAGSRCTIRVEIMFASGEFTGSEVSTLTWSGEGDLSASHVVLDVTRQGIRYQQDAELRR